MSPPRATKMSPPKTTSAQRGRPRLSSSAGMPEERSKKTSRISHDAQKINYCANQCDSTTQTKHELASSALRPGLPKGTLLPCRELERQKISAFLRKGVAQGGSSQVLYISGMPGTGKTAMVLEVLENMRSNAIQFHLAHINAMRLSTPVQVFREIADQLPCAPVNNSEARNHLTNFFYERSERDPVIVLLVDEIDCLKTASQAILYKVFDWLAMPNARLVLASISNTMDLPERLLPRVASRFHIERVDFAPYSRDQIYEILCSRLKGAGALDVFGDVVLRFCAARVSATSGDVRKALQVCRRAIQVCLDASSLEASPVKLAHFQVAEKELLFANPVTQAILNLSVQTRRFLAAAVLEFRLKDDAQAILLQTVCSRFVKILAMTAVDGEQVASCDEGEEMALFLMQRLEAMSIFSKQSRSQMTCADSQTISLGPLDVEDLATALLQVEEDPTIREILEAGSPDLMPGRIFKSID